MIRHAGLVAARVDGRWRGALIEGESGRGKSDLALRALDHGFRLVADDRTNVFVSGGRLFGATPKTLAGLIEARGVGILTLTTLPIAEILLRVRCVTAPDEVERLPDPVSGSLLGVDIPTLNLWPFEASAPHKLILALGHLGASR
jgi:serine kinase of HPr protein (carbohydrate metabolism regulator)